MAAAPTALFRVDASVRMGTGHIYRCVRLAEVLRERGVRCAFLHRLLEGSAYDFLQSRGFEVHALRRPRAATVHAPDGHYEAWAGVTERDDVEECIPVLREMQPSHVVVDHYALGASWHEAVRPLVGSVVVIDDLANRPHNCDFLFDQNLNALGCSRYSGLVPAQCRSECGPRWAMLDPEFARAHETSRVRAGGVNRILVFYGGSDPTRQTLRALRVLCEGDFKHIDVDVVVGASCEFREEVELLALSRGRVEVHSVLPSLLSLMLRADLGLGAGGITMWERCCVGLPSIVTPIAMNQLPASEALRDAGGCLLLSPVRERHDALDRREDEIRTALRSLLHFPDHLIAMARSSWELVDGRGAERVAGVLFPTLH